MFHGVPKLPGAVRVSPSPLPIDSLHFAGLRHGFWNHTLIRRRVPGSVPVITAPFAILVPWIWTPPLRCRVIISNTHDMMIIGIFDVGIDGAQLVEFAAAIDKAEHAKRNNHDDDAWENPFHSEKTLYQSTQSITGNLHADDGS